MDNLQGVITIRNSLTFLLNGNMCVQLICRYVSIGKAKI